MTDGNDTNQDTTLDSGRFDDTAASDDATDSADEPTESTDDSVQPHSNDQPTDDADSDVADTSDHVTTDAETGHDPDDGFENSTVDTDATDRVDADVTDRVEADVSDSADELREDDSATGGHTPLEDVVLDSPGGDSEEASRGLFDDLLSGEPIFENKEVLRPSYTPRKLPHREEQINNMATILVTALRGDTPSNILIYGKTGTGKTARSNTSTARSPTPSTGSSPSSRTSSSTRTRQPSRTRSRTWKTCATARAKTPVSSQTTSSTPSTRSQTVSTPSRPGKTNSTPSP
jgi:cell division control protein 6